MEGAVKKTLVEDFRMVQTQNQMEVEVFQSSSSNGGPAAVGEECSVNQTVEDPEKLHHEGPETNEDSNAESSSKIEEMSRSTESDSKISDTDSDSDERSSLSSRSQEGTPAKKRKFGEEHKRKAMSGLERHRKLKKEGTPFMQKKECVKIKKVKLGRCFDCRAVNREPRVGRRGKYSVCRFLQFRKLRYNDNKLAVVGFPDSLSDGTPEDVKIWIPGNLPVEMSVDWAKYLLTEVGDQFCELALQEQHVKDNLQNQENDKIIWRRPVQDLRELCDVCRTTLFNYHWTCGKCGFVVCMDCFDTRKIQTFDQGKDRDEFGWLKCNAKLHEPKVLMLTEIIAGKALETVCLRLHELRTELGITQGCNCGGVFEKGPHEDELSLKVNCTEGQCQQNGDTNVSVTSKKVQSEDDTDESGDDDDDEGFDLMGLMAAGTNHESTSQKEGDAKVNKDSNGIDEANGSKDIGLITEDCTILDKVVHNDKITQNGVGNMEIIANKEEEIQDVKLTHFIRAGSSTYSIKKVKKEILSMSESCRKYPNVKHTWLCSGTLLRLLNPTASENLKLFQFVWRMGQPVMVSNVAANLNKDLWSPESFSRDFGTKTNDFINCMTGKVVPKQKLKKFWDGFENMKHRLRDDNGTPMLLKLKDWPPGADFASVCESRYEDLMKALPLDEYTHRNGKLNLAGRLPPIFSRPDLGPKMYIAYGSGEHLEKGTTNLHLDISDAVNVMVHVGEIKDQDLTEHRKGVEAAISESDCDSATIRRVKSELPGALWHIWEAKDADKIRDMLNKVAEERGLRIDVHHDAIHDQTWYLDKELRLRLMKDYNVKGYPIIQYAGDAVFVPAGAPHQVRNLNNCIKIAEDFVSPENVRHCFHLTQEFRNLTETHTNHEDKLQIKNIVYHTVKDAISVIEADLKAKKNGV